MNHFSSLRRRGSNIAFFDLIAYFFWQYGCFTYVVCWYEVVIMLAESPSWLSDVIGRYCYQRRPGVPMLGLSDHHWSSVAIRGEPIHCAFNASIFSCVRSSLTSHIATVLHFNFTSIRETVNSITIISMIFLQVHILNWCFVMSRMQALWIVEELLSPGSWDENYFSRSKPSLSPHKTRKPWGPKGRSREILPRAVTAKFPFLNHVLRITDHMGSPCPNVADVCR